MKYIEDVLFYKLFSLDVINFAPINFILLGLIIIGAIVTLKFIRKYLKGFLTDKQFKIEGRQITLFKLAKQFIYIISAALIIESFNINNDHISLSHLLGLKLIDLEDFKLDVSNIIFIFIVFFLAKVVVNVFKLFLHRSFVDRDIQDEGKEYTVVTLAKYLIYTLAIFLSIRNLGVNINILAAIFAPAVIGIGLAAKSFLADIISGFIILFEGTIKVGDIIEVDNLVAKVVHIKVRTSKVITRDGNTIIIPNSKLTDENVMNWSKSSKQTRFKVRVSAAYGSDTSLIQDILILCANNHPAVQQSKTNVMFEEFGDSGLIFDVYFWADKTWDIEQVKSDIRFEIDRKFRENNIKIPFPQRDLHIMSDHTKGQSGN